MDESQKLSTQVLNQDHLSQVMELYQSQNNLMGMERPESLDSKFQSVMWDLYLNPQISDRIAIGSFKEDQLLSMVGMAVWKRMPYWTMSHLLVKRNPNSQLFNPKKNGIWSCLEATFQYAEERGYYRYFSVGSLKHHHGFAKTGMSLDFIKSRYVVCIEDVVPANTRPQYDYVWEMIGQRTWPETLIIRSGSLLSKYRKPFNDMLDEKHTAHYDQKLEP